MLKSDKSENTRKKYIRDITELQAYLSDESVKLSNAAVGAYVKHLLDAGYSISSVNSVISAINTFCSFIDRTDIHCAYLKNFVSVSESRTYLSTAEYQRLIAQAVDNEEYWLAILYRPLAIWISVLMRWISSQWSLCQSAAFQ